MNIFFDSDGEISTSIY